MMDNALKNLLKRAVFWLDQRRLKIPRMKEKMEN